MKKQLLSTSALVAAGMIAAVATPSTVQAQQTAQAPASSPIQVQVGGYMRQYFGYVDQDDTSVASTTVAQQTQTQKPRAINVTSDTEIYFSGKTTLSNGISVAMRVELEGNTSNDMIDESFATIEGAFGQIYLGSTDHVAAKLLIAAPNAAPGPITAVGGVYGNYGLNAGLKNGGSTSVTPGIGNAIQMNDDDAEKISYVTPRFAGFQAGISYTPELVQDHVGAGFARTESRTTYNRGIAVGANFTRAFGAFDVAVGAGYNKLQAPSVDASNPTVATMPDPEGYAIGAQIGYAGFRLGGGYANVKDQAAPLGLAAGNAAGAASNTITGFGDNWNHGSVYEVGLTYTFGPAAVGINYVNGESKDTTALAGDSKYEAIGVNGKYTLGPGVDVIGAVIHYRMKGEGTSTLNGSDIDNTKATAIVTGLSLSF
jgi:outer membrane protein OmpU